MSEHPESTDPVSPSTSANSDNNPTAAKAPGSSSDSVNQVLKVANGYWLKLQPILQVQGIRLLRLTSQTLMGFADRWEKTPISGRPSSTAIEPLPFEETLTKTWKFLSGNWPGVQSRLHELWVWLQPQLLRLEELWLPYLAKIKARLPEGLTQLSDRTLTGILGGMLIVLLWLFNGWTHPHPTIAQTPTPSNELAQRPVEAQPVTRPVTRMTEPVRSPGSTVADQPLEPIASPIQRKSSPLATTSISPSGGRGGRGTDATSKLQQAFTDVSSPYVEDLILSVLPDTASHRVTLKVSSAWYDLEAQEQDQLADAFVHSSQTFKFEKLEIKDSQNELVARTPVVGDQIVILRRHRITTS